ncbi:MAG TPA: glucose-6-phosphate dehydrogenase [Chloroflexota bacterium]
MSATVTPSIDEDIWEDVWEEERVWREENPDQEQVPDPLTLVIFGATGDLAHRKLVPALYNLADQELLPDKLAIVGFGRSQRDDDDFRDGLRQSVEESGTKISPESWDTFAQRITYVRGRYDDEDSFKKLAEELDRIDERAETRNHRLFYLATPPNVYADVVGNLGRAELNKPHEEGGWSRLIVEKPFGRDLETARALDRCIHGVFDESQVYRIDHYLGKETVQNIFVLRFINGIFEPIWNRNYVDHVQITVAESLGVEGRGGYYEEAGAVRDMLQSHLLQLLTLTAMEPPSEFTGDKVRDEKVKVLDALQFPGPDDVGHCVVAGQYSRGMVDGRYVPGYHDEHDVSVRSTTETYVAAKLLVNNWRWAGVPFYLRTGKRMAKRVSEIAIQFRRAPHMLLPGSGQQRPRRNVLVLRIQPDDGLALRLDVKAPGPGLRVRPVDMSFLYKNAFGGSSPEAYQRLLLDAMRGDSTLFARSDEVEAAWSLVTTIFDCWSRDTNRDVPSYPAGSWGPEAAEDLLARDGHHWRKP